MRFVARLIVSAIPFAAACGGEGQATPVPPASATSVRDTALLSPEAARLARFTIVPAAATEWRESWTIPARLTLDPTATQTLGAIAEGRVTRVLVRVGDPVQAGQVLVALHSHEMMDAQSALAKAKAADAATAAESDAAERAAERAERLYALKAASLASLEHARAALARARAARADAQAELARADAMRKHLVGVDAHDEAPADADEHEVLIRAPMSGVVVGLNAQPGAVVLVGAPLVDVSRTSSLMLNLHLPERALALARTGTSIRFTVSAYGKESFDARVIRVAPTLDATTRTFAVQAQVTGRTDRLRAEMYATAELFGPPGEPTVSVPVDAVQSFQGDTVVIAAHERPNGLELEAIRVRVGRRTPSRVSIVDGVSIGLPIVVDGAAIAKAELLRRRGER